MIPLPPPALILPLTLAMSSLNLSSWSERAPMPQPLAGNSVAAWNGKLLVAGGTYWSPEKKMWVDRADAFDPVANRWESLPSLPSIHGDAPCLVVDNVPYIFGGGHDGSTTTTAWSLRSGGWKTEAALTLPAPRKSMAAAVIGKTAYLIGGFEIPNDMNSGRRTVWAWTAGGKGWEVRAPVPGVVRFNPAVAVVGGKILMAGGATMDHGKLENLSDILSYDPATNSWSTVGHLPHASRAGSGESADGKLLIIGGYADNFETAILVFDPATGKTTPAGQLPHGLADARFARIGNKIYGVGGENGVKMRAPWTLEASL